MTTPVRERVPAVCAGVLVADHLCSPIDRLPNAGEVVKADDLILNIGGLAANAAMNLARLGVRASICGRVGDDFFGRFVAETLKERGIETTNLKIDRERPTSQSLIINVKGDDRRFIHSFGANAGFSVADLDAVLDPPPKVLFIGGYLILPDLDPELLANRFAKVRRGGGKTVLDVATPGPADYLPWLTPVLPQTDVFLPNTDEAALILNEEDPLRQALGFQDLGAHHVVITLGDRGAISVSDSLRARVGSYQVPFVDATGGGDAFDSGYIAGLIDGRDEVDCLRLASALGASCVRAVGATAGIFNREEAEEFIKQHALRIYRV
ncbi:MAG: ribokinase [Isosphaeraceae bacterium]